jgi:hypothetical protein
LKLESSLAPILMLVLLSGCSSKELALKHAELTACQDKEQSARQEASSCRQDLAAQQRRWENVQETLLASMPQEVVEIQSEVLENIPEPVKVEVQADLDRYFVAVAREFQHLKRQNEELVQQARSTRRVVTRTQEKVDKVQETAAKIEEGVQAVGQCAQERAAAQARDQQLSEQMESTIGAVAAFDRRTISCKDCNIQTVWGWKKKRSDILSFHDELVKTLSSLQTALAGDGAPSEP